jgi:hypothetical protein
MPKKMKKGRKDPNFSFTHPKIDFENYTQEMQSVTSDNDSSAEMLKLLARYG